MLSRIAPEAIRSPTSRTASSTVRVFRRGVARVRTVPRPLAALLAVATIQVVAWALLLPPFQGPDEDAHFAYVQQLAETGNLPDASGGNGRNVSSEQERAMAWVKLRSLRGIPGDRPAWSEADERRWRRIEASLSGDASADGLGPNAVGQNPPLYYALEAIPYKLAPGGSFLNRFYVTRLASALFYLAIVAVTWLIAAELFRPLWARTLTTAVVALHPKLAMLGGTINPDILLVLAWTAFIYAGLRIVRRGPSLRRLAGAATATAAAFLTHGRGLPILGALAVLLVIAYVRWRPPGRQALLGAGICAGVVGLGLLAVVALSSGGTGGGAYGGEVSRLGGRGFNVREFLSYVWQFYLPRPESLQESIGPPDYGIREVYFQSFYGDLAWLEIQYPAFAIDLLEIATILLLVGLYTIAIRRLDAVRRSWPVISFLALTAIVLIASLHVSSYRDMLVNPADPLFTGRYLFPLLAILAIAVTTLVMALPRRLAPLAAGVVVAGGVVLQLSALGMTLVRFYA